MEKFSAAVDHDSTLRDPNFYPLLSSRQNDSVAKKHQPAVRRFVRVAASRLANTQCGSERH